MNDPDRPLLRFAITFSNAGYMGFPLIEALFGAEGLLYASIFNTFFNILLWTAGVALLAPGSRGRGTDYHCKCNRENKIDSIAVFV